MPLTNQMKPSGKGTGSSLLGYGDLTETRLWMSNGIKESEYTQD